MNEKRKDSISSSINEYTEYFKEDLKAMEEELSKSKEYSKIIDAEIDKIRDYGNGISLNKAGEHYLIQHLTNAVQLQTQRQGLRKDIVNIKKIIMDYAIKVSNGDEEEGPSDLREKIEEIIREDREKAAKLNETSISTQSNESLDAEIDKRLQNKEGN